MTNPILRDCHPAAPRTPENEKHYKDCVWINETLPIETDVEMKAYMIDERGKLTSEVWRMSRKAKTT